VHHCTSFTSPCSPENFPKKEIFDKPSKKDTFLTKGKEMKRDFCETIPQLVHSHDPSGPPVVWNHRHYFGPNLPNAPWVQSKVTELGIATRGILKWFEQNLLNKKWRPNPPTTKVYKKSCFHIFCFHCLGEIRVLISKSSEGFRNLIFVTCLRSRGQVTIPWLKRLTDASPSASEPTLLRFDPEASHHKPGPEYEDAHEQKSWSAWTLGGFVYALSLEWANAPPRQRFETPGSPRHLSFFAWNCAAALLLTM